MKVTDLDIPLDGPSEKMDPKTKLQWVHIMTPGVIECHDGRAFVLEDADAVIANTIRTYGGTDLVVDYDHNSAQNAPNAGRPMLAAGWVKKLENRKGHIWALVQWTDIAAQMIVAKQYRYLSPEFRTIKGTGKIVAIDAVALVNRPAMELTNIASNQLSGGDNMAFEDMEFVDQAKQLLGLDATATTDQIIDKLQALLNAKGAIDGEEMTAVASLMRELSTERHTTQMARIEGKVTQAVTGGFMPRLDDPPLSPRRGRI